jgi:hypothetical protein
MLAHSRQELLDLLRHQVRQIEGARRAHSELVSLGVLDRLLPTEGLQGGTLVEWFAAQAGAGTLTLSLLVARQAAQPGECIVISDRARSFYAPVAVAMGIAAQQLVILHPATAADEIWALDQALRSPGVAAVWAHLTRLEETDFRRLQLAAEEGGTLGLLSRPVRARGQPSWSDVQFLVEPLASQQNRRLRVEVVRLRGGVPGASLVLEIDDITGEAREVSQHETHPVPSLPRLAAATTRRRQA